MVKLVYSLSCNRVSCDTIRYKFIHYSNTDSLIIYIYAEMGCEDIMAQFIHKATNPSEIKL